MSTFLNLKEILIDKDVDRSSSSVSINGDLRAHGTSAMEQSVLHKNKCLEIWLKLCSYSMGVYWVAMMFLFISTIAVLEVVYYFGGEQRNDWYSYLVESSWVITTYCTFLILHYNLTYKSINIYSNKNNFDRIEYYLCSLIFLSARIGLRIFPITLRDKKITKTDFIKETANNISTLILNSITMYSVCLIILSLSLICVNKYNQLIIKIKNTDINIDEIKDEIYKIQTFISEIKSKWQIVASMVFCYHFLVALLNILSWFLATDSQNSVGFVYYHGEETYVQLTTIVFRFSMWMFGLLYGIVRMNSSPSHLARVINKHCSWNDDTQQAKIQRLTTKLLQFPECFKVMFVTIKWKHFTVIIVSALTSLFAALVKKRLQSDPS